jgi:hypothetical protein
LGPALTNRTGGVCHTDPNGTSRIGHAYAATGPSQVLELAALETEQPCSIADLQHSVIATRGGSGE